MQRGVDYIGVGVGAMVFDSQGRVLLAKRGEQVRNEKGKWEFPGGGLELNETCRDGLCREFEEEFGIGIEVLELLDVVDHMIPDEGQHWVAPSYVARLVSGRAKIMEPHKIDDLCWSRLEDIDTAALSLVSLENLKVYRAKYGNTPPLL